MSVPNDRVLGLLDEIKRVAGSASMTGTLRHGVHALALMYNKCLDAAENAVPGTKDLFPTLPEDANVDNIAVWAALLLGYLRPGLLRVDIGLPPGERLGDE